MIESTRVHALTEDKTTWVNNLQIIIVIRSNQ